MDQVVEIKAAAKILVKFEGKEYSMTKPKMAVALAMEEKIAAAKASGSGGTAIVAAYLVGQGLPKEVLEQLDADQIEQVIQVLTPSKKN